MLEGEECKIRTNKKCATLGSLVRNHIIVETVGTFNMTLVPTFVKPQCVHITTNTITSQTCTLPPYCGIASTYELDSHWWGSHSICLGVGQHMDVSTTGKVVLGPNWYKFFAFRVFLVDKNNRKIGETMDALSGRYVIGYNADNWLMMPTYYHDYFVTQDGKELRPPLLHTTPDGKYCVQHLPMYPELLAGKTAPRKDYADLTSAVIGLIGQHAYLICGDKVPQIYDDFGTKMKWLPQCAYNASFTGVWNFHMDNRPEQSTCTAQIQSASFMTAMASSMAEVIGHGVIVIIFQILHLVEMLFEQALSLIVRLNANYRVAEYLLSNLILVYKLRSLSCALYISTCILLYLGFARTEQ